MNTSITSRLAALLASILVTFLAVELIADYAYPESTAVLVASAGQ